MEAFKEVVKICLELQYQPEPEIVPIKDLVDMMKVKLAENNLIMRASTRKYLHAKLEREVTSIRTINVSGELYVFPKNISIEHVILKFLVMKKELNCLKEKYENQTWEEMNLADSMKMVRKEIKRLDDSIPWPPKPTDLVPTKFKMPPYLNLMLTRLLQGDDQRLPPKTERLRMSFAQDLIYAVTQDISISLLLCIIVKSRLSRSVICWNTRLSRWSLQTLLEPSTQRFFTFFVLMCQS